MSRMNVHLPPLDDEYACLEKLFYLALFIIYPSSLPPPFCGLLRCRCTCSGPRIGQVIVSGFCTDRVGRLSKTRDSFQSPAGAPCFQAIKLNLLAVFVPSDRCWASFCESTLPERALCEATSLSDKPRSYPRNRGDSKTFLHNAR